MGSVKILIVDDDRVLRETFSSLLEEEGYTVECAPDGVTALRLLREKKYDITFIDLKMPKMDGISLLSKIKEEKIDTIPIMITGYGTIESAVEAMKEGAYDYIRKPFEMKRIKECIQEALGKKRFHNNVNSAINTVDPLSLVKDLGKTSPVLCVTHDKEICKEIPNATCIHVSEKGGDLHPRDLYRLNDIITIFSRKNPKSVIFIDCLNELLNVHRWENIFTTLSKLITELSESGVRFVISMPETEASTPLEKELTHLITEKHIQPLSDCLANPLRRKIIRFLRKEKKAPFSVLMQSVGEIESPKLSFHLRRLSQEGIITKDGESYALTKSGHLISETLDKLESDLAKDPQSAVALFYRLTPDEKEK